MATNFTEQEDMEQSDYDESRSSIPRAEDSTNYCMKRQDIENKIRFAAKLKECYRDRLALFDSFNVDPESTEYSSTVYWLNEKDF
ncbi:hypothetical protein NPIL_262431 [Nephila pilipes]|uniref:Uncharacterized protein n=1 Tax=Nephila pilipes TaxID=299642 RepID=A0A8X6U6B1_NEPPI|nr:hypothetical protein NPIL_262431 [Nephila pilipes]